MEPTLPNRQVVPAALAGVAAGALTVTVALGMPDILRGDWGVLFMLTIVWVSVAAVFLMGFIVLGIPAWMLAHRLGRHGWGDGALIGAVLAGLAYFLFALPSAHSDYRGGGADLVIDGHYTIAGWISAVRGSAIMAIGGAISGLTIWYFVYRKPTS